MMQNPMMQNPIAGGNPTRGDPVRAPSQGTLDVAPTAAAAAAPPPPVPSSPAPPLPAPSRLAARVAALSLKSKLPELQAAARARGIDPSGMDKVGGLFPALGSVLPHFVCLHAHSPSLSLPMTPVCFGCLLPTYVFE